MFDDRMRDAKDVLLSPLATALQKTHPLAFTFIGFGFGLLASLALARQSYTWGFVLWILNRFFDGLDGAVARLHTRQSDLGKYLDLLLDFVIYAAIPVSLVIGVPSPALYVSLAILLSSYYVNAASWIYLSFLLENKSHRPGEGGEIDSFSIPTGLIGGTETILFYSAFILWPQHLVILFNIMSGLVIVSILQRLLWARKYLT